jgi:hypothetical protein
LEKKIGPKSDWPNWEMKTQSYTRNLITSIMDADGSAIFNHDHKAAIICFKDRLGMTANPIMAFKLE